jgi:hypothetical protein
MTTTAQADIKDTTGLRISSYLLVEYLERIGVEVIFGLCGHANIAFLDADRQEPDPLHLDPPRTGGSPRR